MIDYWIIISWVPGSVWALLVPVATCAILVYAIESVGREQEDDGSFRPTIRKERHHKIVVSLPTSVIVNVEEEDVVDDGSWK